MFYIRGQFWRISINTVRPRPPTPPTVWPDWAIYWTLGNFPKPLATINLPKSPTFSGIFWKGVKIYFFVEKLFLRNFYRHLAIFSSHTGHQQQPQQRRRDDEDVSMSLEHHREWAADIVERLHLYFAGSTRWTWENPSRHPWMFKNHRKIFSQSLHFKF